MYFQPRGRLEATMSAASPGRLGIVDHQGRPHQLPAGSRRAVAARPDLDGGIRQDLVALEVRPKTNDIFPAAAQPIAVAGKDGRLVLVHSSRQFIGPRSESASSFRVARRRGECLFHKQPDNVGIEQFLVGGAAVARRRSSAGDQATGSWWQKKTKGSGMS